MEGTFIDGKYEVLRQLGQGGMGAVYEARHSSTGRKVAVKVIVPAALAAGVDIIARFQREARASGSIDSPFVVQVLDAGVDSKTGAPYMAMECLSGEDVQAAVARLGPLPPEVVLRITAHACHGLQKAHEAGIVHRDIKSANLFLAHREDDESELITKILDFGIAKVRASPLVGEDHKLTKTGSMLGSPVYMSPEQAVGAKDLDARSDIFSMGVMMYEALSGATPNGHLENLGALLMAICAQQTQSIQDRAPWVSAEVAAVVHKALERSPADRYQSAAELRAAVVALLPGGDTKLTRSMVGALPSELKLHRAPRPAIASSPNSFAETIPAGDSGRAVAERPTDSAPGARAGTNPVMSTTAGLGTSDIPASAAPRPRRWGAVVGAVAAVVVLGGGAVYFGQRRAPATPARPSGLAVETPSASAPPAPREAVRTEMVSVAPAHATVEVDGKSVAVVGGRFEVSGAVGSVHDVRVRFGGEESRVDVVLAATGPKPPHVEVALKTTAPASAAPPRDARPGRPAVAQPAQPSSAPAPPPSTKPVVPPPNTPPVDRVFN